MNRDIPEAKTATLSAELNRLVRDTALRLGMTAPDAEKAARLGALNIGDALVMTLDLPGGEGTVGHDMIVATSLDGVRPTTLEHMQLLLRTNLMLCPTAGLTFGATEDGTLQLMYPARRRDVTPELLAERMQRLALIAGAVREEVSSSTGAGSAAGASAPLAPLPPFARAMP